MPSAIDREGWSGEGDFTQMLIDWLSDQNGVAFLRVEDAPSTRSDVEYNFISNEIYLGFQTQERVEREHLWGVFPRRRTITDKLMTISELESVLNEASEIESPDYADDGMIQFLHTQRIVPPYQTKGYKLIELVRLYEVGTPRRDS